MKKLKRGTGWDRNVSFAEAVVYLVPVFLLFAPFLVFIFVPKTDFTIALFSGWNVLFIIVATMLGVLWVTYKIWKWEIRRKIDQEQQVEKKQQSINPARLKELRRRDNKHSTAK